MGAISVVEHPAHIQIEQIYIEPAAQNRGVGTMLIRDLIEHALRRVRPLRLRVLRPNPARLLYLRLGFVVTEETPERYFMEYSRG